MANINISDPKVDIKFTVNGNANAKRDSLIEGGPLHINAAHWLVTARPSRLQALPNGNYVLTLHFMEFIVLHVLVWHSNITNRDFKWYVLPARFARLLAHAVAVGSLPFVAFTSDWHLVLHLRNILPLLPPGEDMLLETDIHAYAVAGAPVTLVDFVIPTAMVRNGDMATAVAWKLAFSDGYVETRRTNRNGHFATMQMVAIDAVSDSLASKPVATQAAKLTQFFVSTQPDTTALLTYKPWKEQSIDLVRRGQSTPSARFIPLLEACIDDGRDGGYYKLRTLFCNPSSGHEFVQDVGVLATRVKMESALTHMICRALEDLLTEEAMAQVNTPVLSIATNAARGRVVGDYLATHLARAGTDKNPSDRAELDKMHRSTTFTTLTSDLDAVNVTNPDYSAVIKIMARTAAGCHFLAMKVNPAPVFLNFKAARESHIMDLAFNSVLAVDEAGTPLGKTVTRPGIGKLFITGHYDPKSFQPWAMMVSGVIEARDGKHAAQMEKQSAESFWHDSKRLQLAEPILSAAFSLIGKDGRGAASYRAFHRFMIDNARAIDVLPDSFKRKAKLYIKLAKIGSLGMQNDAELRQLMLKEPLERATMDSDFFHAGSECDREMQEFVADLKEAKSKVRLHDDYGDDDDEFDHKGRHRKRYERDDDESWHHESPWQQQKPDITRGSKLTHYGVWLSSEGPVFGARYLICVTAGATVINPNTCLGRICHHTQEWQRLAWCNGKCSDHQRPKGLDEGDFRIVDLCSKTPSASDKVTIDKVMAAKASWTLLGGKNDRNAVLGMRDPSGGGAGSSTGGGGSRNRGGKGKGKGRLSSNGGKGGNGGKGSKGGKGKGKRNFGRQY